MLFASQFRNQCSFSSGFSIKHHIKSIICIVLIYGIMLYGYRLISTKVRSIIVVSFDLHSLTGAGFGMVLTSIAPDGTGTIFSRKY